MELFVKTLQELTPEELFEIYKLRVCCGAEVPVSGSG